jgi:NADH-quinone oxidoreductase subunit H
MLDWIELHIPAWVYIAVISHLAILGAVAYLILLERKVASWAQDRIGPNRVGLGFGILPVIKNWHMFGLGQPLADGLKFIVKEDYRPKHVDKVLFTLAPMIMIIPVIVSIAVLPWGGVKQTTKTVDVTGVNAADTKAVEAAAADKLPINAREIHADKVEQVGGQTIATVTYRWGFQAANLNVGVLFVLAILSLAVYGVVIGGWASNNKYSFLGGLRATANMISYEIPLGVAVLTIVVMFGTLELDKIVAMQAHYWVGFIPAWNVFTQPLAFLMFLICIHAEANRAPFDLAEAEQELVGGYHTEYSAMRFALFFLAEYAGMITTSAVCVALFFGGWHFPGLTGDVNAAQPDVTTSLLVCLLRALVFFIKTLVIIFVFMWVRWSLPRFRFDQLMMLAWRALIPMSLALLVMTAFVMYFTSAQSLGGVDGRTAVIFLGTNIAMAVVMLLVSSMLPAPPATNRRIAIPGSRYEKTPLPAGA